mgnify:FL=1
MWKLIFMMVIATIIILKLFPTYRKFNLKARSECSGCSFEEQHFYIQSSYFFCANEECMEIFIYFNIPRVSPNSY